MPMNVYLTFPAGPLADVRQRVAALEALGVTGVLLSDHLFVANQVPRAQARRPHEPITLLAAIATLSERLHIGTIVSNIGLLHPALVLRQFAQLAQLFGGERVLAGLGAGWNREEFDAIGMRMPTHAQRVDRLEEAAHLARDLFDNGIASLEGSQVVARELPLAPLPAQPPRVLLGGGSDRLLEIAGRYADMLDLNGSSRSTKVAGRDLPGADNRRRLATTIADLEDSVGRARAASDSAGRRPAAVSMSIVIGYVAHCSNAEIDDAASRICATAGLAPQSLDACPYALIGEPDRMADQLRERRDRLGLEAIILPSSIDQRRLVEEVLPRL